MNARENTATIPESYAMDYKALLSVARAESATNLALFLRTQLPFKWRDLYVAAVARPTNIVNSSLAASSTFTTSIPNSKLRARYRTTRRLRTGWLPYLEHPHAPMSRVMDAECEIGSRQLKNSWDQIETKDTSSHTASAAGSV